MITVLHELPERYEVLRTTDIECARDVIGQFIQPHHMRAMSRDQGRAPISLRFAAGKKLGIGTAHYAKDVTIDPMVFDRFFLVQVPLSGRSILHQGAHSTTTEPGSGWIASLNQPTSIDQHGDVQQFLIKVEKEKVQTACSQILGRSLDQAVQFAPMLDLAAGAGSTIWRSIQFLTQEFAGLGENEAHPLILAQLEDAVIMAMLLGQPHTYSQAIAALRSAPESPRALRRLVDQVKAHPEHPWTLSALADAAGVSARTLQLACQRHLGCSPMALVREVRLERVHADLLSAGPGASVTTIAMTWGFYQLGRFAQDYRKRFGEVPSATLRRG
jgi:AraC-like DNA-binding protein